MKTLKLFNAVIEKKGNQPIIDYENGLIIESGAIWCISRIGEYYSKERLNGNDLNKTFHKSWIKIKESSRYELLIEQITHYISTYGSDFKDEIYIPNELLDLEGLKVKFKVIKSYTKEELQDKCLGLLRSGVALKEETVNDILTLLVDDLDYSFTGKEGIKNKEAIVKIADLYNVLPDDTMEFFRYVIYRATGTTLLIKNESSIEEIKNSSFNPSIQFQKFGLVRLSQIFNRYKPLFLAFKGKCPKVINKISKLSKTNHKPLVQNPLNFITNKPLEQSELHWLKNATPYALFKALTACYTRNQGQSQFVYRIRNGRSWVKEGKPSLNNGFQQLLSEIKDRYDFTGKSFYIPDGVEYALPTSEKMFVGNIPTGTKFFGDKLAVGVYWKNSWGACDLDLSGINIGGKVGWNASYNHGKGSLMYSGDMTNAPNGAVEYLHANKGLKHPTLVQNNVYSGEKDCDYKIVIGNGDDITRSFMQNPERLIADIKCQSVQKQTILGMFLPTKEGQSFVLLNFGAGNCRVSGNNEISKIATSALYQQWNNPFTFNYLIEYLGGTYTTIKEEADFDLSVDSLEKDTLLKVFNEEKEVIEHQSI